MGGFHSKYIKTTYVNEAIPIIETPRVKSLIRRMIVVKAYSLLPDRGLTKQKPKLNITRVGRDHFMALMRYILSNAVYPSTQAYENVPKNNSYWCNSFVSDIKMFLEANHTDINNIDAWFLDNEYDDYVLPEEESEKDGSSTDTTSSDSEKVDSSSGGSDPADDTCSDSEHQPEDDCCFAEIK